MRAVIIVATKVGFIDDLLNTEAVVDIWTANGRSVRISEFAKPDDKGPVWAAFSHYAKR